MAETDVDIEVVPLQRRISSRSASYRSQIEVMEPSPSSLIRQTIAVLLLSVVGWYGPRAMIAIETSIAQRPAPYQVTAAGDVILDMELNQPLVDPPTIPSNLLVWASVGIPLTLVAVVSWLGTYPTRLQRLYTVHAAVCGLILAIGLSESSTQLLKLAVQRRRPNFYAICGFDAAVRRCTADLGHQREANFSFPSGHSSLAMCAMVYIGLTLLARTLSSSLPISSKRWLGLAVFLTPPSWAVFVGASRLVDHWHHPSDVVAGLCLGAFTSTTAYHVWFPPVWHVSVGRPWTWLEIGDGGKLPSFHE